MFLGRSAPDGWVAALVIKMASEPQEVFGAATRGHQHVKSSQHTLPMANNAGHPPGGKKSKKPLMRIFLSLDNCGPP